MPTQTKTRKSGQKTTQNLGDLLVTKLQALYDVENQLIKALPAMVKGATDPDLKDAFDTHLEQTKTHAERLEEAFRILEADAKKLQGDAIRGMVSDAEWVMKHVKGDASLDANLVAAAQYVEHYEIAGYGSAIAWAKLLSQQEVAELLEKTLTEEKEANDLLGQLAEKKLNERAAVAGMDGDEEDE